MSNTQARRKLGTWSCAALICAAVPLLANATDTSTDGQKAYADLQTALATAKSNGAIDATRSLNDQLKGYPWRTVYEFKQVQKTNLPGTRIALVALPTWSQLDAENYLIKNNLPFSGGPAPMNCPVAQLGGAAGRLIEVTVNGKTTTLTDDQIKQKLNVVDAATGKTTWDSFVAFRGNFCATVFNLAQLSFRYKQYQAAQSHLAECKDNGLQITTWEKKQGFDFPNNKHRTAAVGGGILFKCGKADKNDSSQGIGYDSWFKWSDDDPVPLNILQTLAQSPPSKNECPKTCIPMVKSGGVDAKLCVGLDPGYNNADATVSLKLGGSFKWDGRGKSLCSPTISVPAPFGIAASLDELADSAKQSLKDKMQSQLNASLAKDGNPAVKLQTLLGKSQ